jgi:hypothetical protein
MRYHRAIRTVSVLASAALVLGAVSSLPAEAKKKKKKKPKACATYVPSEWGEGQPVNLVTDEHTAEAPLEITVPTEPGLGFSSTEPPGSEEPATPSTHSFLNVQVDSKLPETGLYGTLSYTPGLDYDLYFRDNGGFSLAASNGFMPGVPNLDGTGSGGHTEMGSENIEGLTTADCTGYLVDVVSATTPGGDVTLTLWLGEATYTPGG